MKDSNQQAMDFLGHQIHCIQDADGNPNVPLKWLCEVLGISNYQQRSEIKHYVSFNGKMVSGKGADGKYRRMFCLPLEQVYFWIYTIDPDTVKPGIKERLVAYHEKSPVAFRLTKEYRMAFDPRSSAEEIESHVRAYFEGFLQKWAPDEVRNSTVLLREMEVFRQFEKEGPQYRDKALECIELAMNNYGELMANFKKGAEPDDKLEKMEDLRSLEKDYRDLHSVKDDLLELCNRLGDKEPELRDQLYQFFCRVHERCEANFRQILDVKKDLGCRYYWQPSCEEIYKELNLMRLASDAK